MYFQRLQGPLSHKIHHNSRWSSMNSECHFTILLCTCMFIYSASENPLLQLNCSFRDPLKRFVYRWVSLFWSGFWQKQIKHARQNKPFHMTKTTTSLGTWFYPCERVHEVKPRLFKWIMFANEKRQLANLNKKNIT